MADEKKPEKQPDKQTEKQPEKGKRPPSQSQTQQQKKRERDLEEFDRQVEEGSVTIRKMTPAERKANPPRDRPPKKRRT
ncbi:MAG: hypothetical protein QOG41_2302 [Thermoleophilaceae bacterium]|jgi:hypothetical protein|nr:hypothetical protein [Thermoleophilaceae bacterium]